MEQAGTYEFGPYRLEAESRTLTRDGEAVTLPPRTFDLLTYLLASSGRLLSKNELLREVWGDVNVEEASLAFQVSALRKAFGSEGSAWIETVPKHGYRFVAPVRLALTGTRAEVTATEPEAAEPQLVSPREIVPPGTEAATPERRKRLPKAYGVALGISLLTVVLFAGWRVVENRRATKATLSALNPEPITSYPGPEKQPSLSPDGSQVAFVWRADSDQNARIYVQLAGGQGSPVPLTSGLRPEFSPSWSPNGDLIAFCRQALSSAQRPPGSGEAGAGGAKGAEIVVIPARGGSERIVARSRNDWFPACDESWPILSWFPNSDALAVTATQEGPERGSSSIWMVSVNGERRQALTMPSPLTAGDRLPAVSPDGRFLAFVRSLNQYWVAHEIYVLALDARNTQKGDPSVLLKSKLTSQTSTTRQSQVTGLAWMPGENHQLLFTRRGLWRAAVDSGGEASYVPLSASDPRALSISKDGQHLVFSSGYWDLDVWRMPGPTAQERAENAEGKPFLAGTRLDTNPQYSPDGTKLAFTSMRTGILQVWVADNDGGNPMQLTRSEAATGSPHWSPDGRYIAFDSVPASSEKGGIYVIPSAGGPVRRFTANESHAHLPSWSVDGRWIYFESDRGGRLELWKQEFPSGRAERVAGDGAAGAFESPDAEWVYYSRRTRPGLWRQPIAGGQEEVVSDRGNPLFWGFYKQGLCLLDPDPERVQVKCGRLQDTRFAVLTSFANGGHVRPTGPSFAVSPDGKWILYTRVVREETDLMMVDNLAAALPN